MKKGVLAIKDKDISKLVKKFWAGENIYGFFVCHEGLYDTPEMGGHV